MYKLLASVYDLGLKTEQRIDVKGTFKSIDDVESEIRKITKWGEHQTLISSCQNFYWGQDYTDNLDYKFVVERVA